MNNEIKGIDYGFIVVSVRTARGAIPIEGAMVTIQKHGEENDNDSDIISIEFTDSSGMTPKLMVETPPKMLSEHPNAESQPYGVYTIRTDKVGYYSVYNINISVFADITSVQPIEMIPLPDEAGSENHLKYQEVYNISQSQTL